MINPALSTRAAVQDAIVALLDSTQSYTSEGYARVRLGVNSAHFPQIASEVEGYTRLLWGLVPLLAGGGKYSGTDRFLLGLANGTNPAHPEYWGEPADCDQLLVESSALAYALLLAPDSFWVPLDSTSQKNVAKWISQVASRKVWDNNWLFFHVLVNLALKSLDLKYDAPGMKAALERIESFYLSEGWYRDGPFGPCDLYNSFVFHFYGLLYSNFAEHHDPERAERLRSRTYEFLEQYIAWFSEDGSAIPYGRSLVYRFAQGSVWSALTFSSKCNLPWGVVKGIVLRHLRYWFQQPILSSEGLLTPGYAYQNPKIGEPYISSSSPYWALKCFAILNASEDHPFWTCAEEPLPKQDGTTYQPCPRMIICRAGSHVFSLSGGQTTLSTLTHAAEKYSKFCYSNQFGFSVPADASALSLLAPDSTLLLSEDERWWRFRLETLVVKFQQNCVLSEWKPWPSVRLRTWLVPVSSWHIRVHLLETDRSLHSVEGGFAINHDLGVPSNKLTMVTDRRSGVACHGRSISIIRELNAHREPHVLRIAPNTNILFPRTSIPVLRSYHSPGMHWLVSCVGAWLDASSCEDEIAQCPSCQFDHGKSLSLRDASGGEIFKLSSDDFH